MAKTRKPHSPVQERDPERENAVRVAALVAAGGKSVPESVLNDIVVKATRPGMSMAQSVNEAASAIQQIVNASTPVNITAAPQAGQIGPHHHVKGRLGEDQRALAFEDYGERAGPAGGNGARFDGISRSEAAYLAEMRGHALKHGLDWAADNRDILRLGPAAIETFARMKFDKDSYHALTRDAGLSPEKAHGLVKAMEGAKVTPDEAKELAKRMGATGKGLTPELQEQHRVLMENWLKALKDDPGAAPAELGKLHKWLDERKATDPDKATAVEEERKATIKVQERLQQERAKELRSERVIASEAVKVESNNNALAALLGKPPVAVPPAAPVPGSPPPSPPTVPEPPKAASPGSPPSPTAATPKP